MRRVLLCVALLAPALALAKAKVVLDAARPVGPLLEKALKAKYAINKQSLASEPTGGDVKAACREAGGAIAVITARQGGGDVWTVMVLNGADGSPLSTFRLKVGKKPPKALPKPDVKKLLEGLDDAKAPKKEKEEPKPPPEEAKPPPEEKKEEPVAEKPPEEKPREKARSKPTDPPAPPSEEVREREEEPVAREATKKSYALRLGAGFKVFSRRFGYTDDIFDALSTYYLPGGPAIGAELELFPAAFITNGFAGNIGVLAEFNSAVGIASRAEDGTRYGTSSLNLRAGLTVRIPVSVITVMPHVGYSLQTYGISASNGTKPNIPSVSYGAFRGGLLIKAKIFGPVGVQLGIAGQYLLSKGEISTYFPHASANGLDTGGAITIGLFDRLELKVGGEYQRYWYSMNPVPGDTNVAGGALDIYASGYASIAFML